MANALNRTTLAYMRSINTPDYPVADWVIDPDMSAVAGYPRKYWLLSGDKVTLMSQAERDAVDAAELSAQKDSLAEQLDISGFDRAFAEIMLDEINLLRQRANMTPRTLIQLKTALRNKL